MTNTRMADVTKGCFLVLLLLLGALFIFPYSVYAQEEQVSEWSLETTEFESTIDNENGFVSIVSESYDMEFTVESSDSDIVTAMYSEPDCGLYLTYHQVGTATITVTDTFGKSESCEVNVTYPKWYLNQTEMTVSLSDHYCNLQLVDVGENLVLENDFTVVSSDNDIVSVDELSNNTISLYLWCSGTATITVTDKYGKSESCIVTVPVPEWHLETDTFEDTVDDYGYVEIISDDYDINYTVTSSNPDVVTAVYDEYYDEDLGDDRYGLKLTYYQAGTATITVTDPMGKQENCAVIVKPAKWHLKTNQMTVYITDGYGYLDIEDLSDHLDLYDDFSITSSNSSIVSIEDTLVDSIRLACNKIGTATITVTDCYGKTETCKVTVKPAPFTLAYTSKTFNEYDCYAYAYANTCYVTSDSYNNYNNADNYIKAASTSNTKVVTFSKASDGSYINLKPAGVGYAVVTVKDQYGQTVKINVKVTQKYIDESKYLDKLSSAFTFGLEYGETKLTCVCDEIAATVYTTINGTKYTAKLDSEGYYVFSKIPKLAAGKKITVCFQKGQAIYKETVTVQKVNGRYTTVKTSNRTYTGKALGSTLTVKYGSTVLKKGTDYTVKFANNINVGKATATITFIGNYKGAKTATYSICPKGTTISSLTAGRRAFTVKWAKQTAKMSTSQITGYVIQYSTSSTFATGNKTVVVKGVNTAYRKISSLTAKKRYYVRVRTYKTVSGKNYYSTWSPVKYVTTK